MGVKVCVYPSVDFSHSAGTEIRNTTDGKKLKEEHLFFKVWMLERVDRLVPKYQSTIKAETRLGVKVVPFFCQVWQSAAPSAAPSVLHRCN